MKKELLINGGALNAPVVSALAADENAIHARHGSTVFHAVPMFTAYLLCS